MIYRLPKEVNKGKHRITAQSSWL